MSSEDLKRRLDAVDRYLEEMEDVDPENPFFLLVIYVEGMRTALRAILRAK